MIEIARWLSSTTIPFSQDVLGQAAIRDKFILVVMMRLLVSVLRVLYPFLGFLEENETLLPPLFLLKLPLFLSGMLQEVAILTPKSQ